MLCTSNRHRARSLCWERVAAWEISLSSRDPLIPGLPRGAWLHRSPCGALRHGPAALTAGSRGCGWRQQGLAALQAGVGCLLPAPSWAVHKWSLGSLGRRSFSLMRGSLHPAAPGSPIALFVLI